MFVPWQARRGYFVWLLCRYRLAFGPLSGTSAASHSSLIAEYLDRSAHLTFASGSKNALHYQISASPDAAFCDKAIARSRPSKDRLFVYAGLNNKKLSPPLPASLFTLAFPCDLGPFRIRSGSRPLPFFLLCDTACEPFQPLGLTLLCHSRVSQALHHPCRRLYRVPCLCARDHLRLYDFPSPLR